MRNQALSEPQKRMLKAYENNKCVIVWQPMAEQEARKTLHEYTRVGHVLFLDRQKRGLTGAPTLPETVEFFKDRLGPHTYCYSSGVRVWYWINSEENWILEVGKRGWSLWTRPPHVVWVDLDAAQREENSAAAARTWQDFFSRIDEKLIPLR